MDKSLIIVIDQFSDRVLANSNVTLFDYGKLEKVAYIDNYYNVYNGSFSGYGNYDDVLLVEDYGYGFFPVSKDEILYSYTSDLDFIDRLPFVDIFGLTAYADNFLSFSRTNQSSELSVNHGDWVVEALLQTLDRPQYTEIICIDVDTLNGEFSHFDDVFDQTLIYFNGTTHIGSNLENILTNFLAARDTRFNTFGSAQYAFGGISLSIGGTLPDINEAIFLDFLETVKVPIFQAAPNVNQGYFDYAMVFPNVITVGAWNKTNTNNLLLGSDSTIATIDIVADGSVSRAGWGSNFGTSFATPKVAAEFLNILNNAIVSLNNSGQSLSDIETPNIDGIIYSDFVDSIVSTISTDVSATINDTQISGIKVLSSTIQQNGYMPKTVSGATGSSLIISSATADIPQTNRPPSGSVTISGTPTQGQTLTASNTLSDVDGLGAITYTWKAGATTLGTGDTYTLTQAEVGKTLMVIASYTDGGNTAEAVTSAATAAVANVDDEATGTLNVIGAAEEGGRLTASLSDVSDADGATTTTYRWQELVGGASANISSMVPAETGNHLAALRADYRRTFDFSAAPITLSVGGDPLLLNVNYNKNFSSYEDLFIKFIFEDFSRPITKSGLILSDQASPPPYAEATEWGYAVMTGSSVSVTSEFSSWNSGWGSDHWLNAGAPEIAHEILDGKFTYFFQNAPLSLTPGLTSKENLVVVSAEVVLRGAVPVQEATSPENATEVGIWTDLSGATTATLAIPDDQSFLGKQVRVVATTTDVLGGTTEFNSEAILVQAAGVPVNVEVRAWKTLDVLPNVEVAIGSSKQATDAVGMARFTSIVESSMAVSATVSPTSPNDTGASASVTLQDAVSILKMIAGQPVNTTPISRFQSLAADFDGSGTVSLADALGVLRHAVGLQAPKPSWVFVEEGDDALPSTLSPGVPGPVTVDVTTPGPIEVNLIGVLRGDVDGSYGVYGG